MSPRVKRVSQRHEFGIALSFALFVAFSMGFLFPPCNAVPLNVANIENMEGIPRMRADYGFYPDKNTSFLHTTNYVNLMTAKSPITTNSIHHRSGCRYKATLYASGENVPTEESCLFCHCKGTVVICKLRVCREIPDQTPPPGCIIVQKANKCCSQLICNDNHLRNKLSREQRLDDEANNGTESLPSSALETLEQGNSCVHEGTIYAEGSAMRSSTLCEHCFCIHGKMKCSSPQCLIPLNGCKPRYRSYACCPTNYDCNQSNETAILKTTPSTPVPDFLKGCRVGGRYIAEGQPILPMQIASDHGNNSLGLGINRCQTCFCMGGVVHCRPLACDRPIEGCTPIIEVGHCCPDRYECDKDKALQGQNEEMSTIAEEREIETQAPTTTELPETSSTQVYEIRFEKVPLFKARKDDGGEWTTSRSSSMLADKPRVSTLTSIGGFFKNMAGIDRGSREHKKNKKEKQEFRGFDEDEETGEDGSNSFENSGPSDEQSSVFFDEKSDGSNSNSDGDEFNGTESSLVPELNEVVTDSENATPTARNVNDAEDGGITEKVRGNVGNSRLEISVLPLTLTNDLKLEPILVNKIASSSTTPSPRLSSSSNPTPTPRIASSTIESESATGDKLEFISFGAEDAVFSPMNETRYEIYPGKATSVPIPNYGSVARQASPSSLQKRILQSPPNLNKKNNLDPRKPSIPMERLAPADGILTAATPTHLQPVEPIVFEQEDLHNSIFDVPVQTSLYNNGFFGQGAMEDPNDKIEDLVITQAEMSKPVENIHETSTVPTTTTTATPAPPRLATAPQKQVPIVTISNKKPEQPLIAISSNQKFIPSSFRPLILPNVNDTKTHPSRTYSKFGIQDSSYRNGQGSLGGVGDEEEQFFVQLPLHNPTQTSPYLMNRKVPSFQEPTRYHYNPHHQQTFPLPILSSYDEAEAEGSEEFASYESYFNPLIPTNIKRPTAPSNIGPQYGASSHLTSTITPPSHQSNNPVPMISSSGTKVSLSSKDTTRPSPNTKFVNSKPLKRPKPVQTLEASDPLGFKPVIAFPFTIPKSQDKFTLGLKLSGCNIYGKMYGVGSVIHELSSICVQCKCTEVGVQCSELQC